MSNPHKATNTLTSIQDDEYMAIRNERFLEINLSPGTRAHLIEKYGQVWDPQELTTDFEVIEWQQPFVAVRYKADGRVGTLEYQRNPRFYFNFIPDKW